MRKLSFLLPLIIAACSLVGCKHSPAIIAPAPIVALAPPGPAAAHSDAIDNARASRAAASVAAASVAVDHVAESPARTAATRELGVAAANLPAPAAEDSAAALARVNAALAGRLADVEKQWEAATKEAAESRAASVAAAAAAQREGVAAAEKMQARENEWVSTFSRMRAEAAQREEAIKREAEADMKRLIGYIFFGGAAVAIAAGVACLTVLAGLPFVGGKLVTGCFVLAGVLGSVGVALIRALDSPWIARGVVAAGVLALVLVVVGYLNHWHAKAPPSPPPLPVT